MLSNQTFIVFADDPLSGLDSLSSYMLVETLQRLANNGFTILCTLDQPTSDVYALFNKYVHTIQGNALIAYIVRLETSHILEIDDPFGKV